MKLSPALQRASTVLVTLLGVGGLIWVLRKTDTDLLKATWLATPLWVWAVCAGGMAFSHMLRAGRMRAEWAPTLSMDWRHAWALVVRHSMWVVLTPLRSGEAIYVWILNQQGQVPAKTAALSLLKLRIQDAVVLAVCAAAAFAPLPFVGTAALAAVLVAFTVVAMPLIWPRLMRLARRSNPDNEPLPQAPAYASWFFAYSNWVVKLIAIAVPLQYLTHSPFVAGLRGAVAGEWAAVLPIQAPAGFGTYEAGVMAGMQWGSTAAWPTLATAALAVHVVLLAVTVLSGLMASWLGWSHAEWAPKNGA